MTESEISDNQELNLIQDFVKQELTNIPSLMRKAIIPSNQELQEVRREKNRIKRHTLGQLNRAIELERGQKQ